MLQQMLEGGSLRDIASTYGIGHMVVASKLREAYGRYVTNDEVTSCYRSLLKDYSHYKNGTTRQKVLYNELLVWCKSELLRTVAWFTQTHEDVALVKDAIKDTTKYYSEFTLNGKRMYLRSLDAEIPGMENTTRMDRLAAPIEYHPQRWQLTIQLTLLVYDCIVEVLAQCLEEKARNQ